MANSNPEIAIINARGIIPTKNNKNPDVSMLYAKPDNMFNNKCPAIMLALKRSPKLTFLARYEINSIKTNRGSNPKGQPAGTNKEKNSRRCFCRPIIVAPNTTVKLREKVKIK